MKTTQGELTGNVVTIIVAWVEEDMRVVREGRPDIGQRPLMRAMRVAKTLLWLNEGGREDVAKARAYAFSQGASHRVYTYMTSHADPRGAAAKAILSV